MTAYLVIFAAGFAGSFHCIGMCGGFACALGRDPQGGGATVLRHLLYNTGRLTTYCFLGGLAGALGQVICTSQGVTVPLLSGPLDGGQRILAIVSGLLMIAMALQFFGLLNRVHHVAIGFGGQHSRCVVAQPAHGTRPCSAACFRRVQRLPALSAGLRLRRPGGEHRRRAPRLPHHGSFGLGTFPAMLLMGGVGRMLAPAWRQRGVWLAGSCILLLGLITLGRGVLPFAAHIADSWHGGHPA